jgi:phospholipase/carboxylesterase
MSSPLVTEPTAAHDASIIWMHGLGASANDFADMPGIIPRPGTRWIFPNAPVRPVTLNNGMRMRSWFDIRYMGGGEESGERESPEEAADSHRIITELIEAEHAKGIPAHRIVLVGFSQGGAMSLYTGTRTTETLAGMVCLSGYLLFNEVQLEAAHPNNRQTPVLICHGTHDDVVPYRSGFLSAGFMKTHGWPVAFEEYPMQHEVSMPEIRRIGEFFAEVLDQN